MPEKRKPYNSSVIQHYKRYSNANLHIESRTLLDVAQQALDAPFVPSNENGRAKEPAMRDARESAARRVGILKNLGYIAVLRQKNARQDFLQSTTVDVAWGSRVRRSSRRQPIWQPPACAALRHVGN